MNGKPSSTTRFSARDHLLGRLHESEVEHADELAISDSEYYAALIAEEESLIEGFAASRLSPEDERDFRRMCAKRPDLRERVALERAIQQKFRPRRARLLNGVVAAFGAMFHGPSQGWPVAVAAGVALALVPAAVFVGYRVSEKKRELSDKEWARKYESQRERVAQLEAEKRLVEERLGAKLGEADSRSGDRARTESGPPRLLASIRVMPLSRGVEEPTAFPISGMPGLVEVKFAIGNDTAFHQYRVSVQSGRVQVAQAVAEPKVIDDYRVVSIRFPVQFRGTRHFSASVKGIVPGSDDQLVENYNFDLSTGVLKH